MVTYRSLLNEGVESKNMRAAKHYIYNFIGRNDENKAMEIIGGIKHDIPNSRLAQCKFMLGVTRMFMAGQLTNAEDITSLNRTLKYVATEAHVNEYNQDLNGLSAEKLIERFSQTITDDLEAEKKQISARQYTKNNEYDIVKIKDFDMASEYGDYTDWCVTQYEDNFNAYTGGGLGVFYFCLKKGFQNVERVKGENCPLDEYGLSMIAVSVNYDGSCNTITCRWNHENGGNDNIMSVTQLSDLLGCNFYDVFLPKTDEEIKEFTQNVNMEIKEQLKREDAFVYETFPYKGDVEGDFHDDVLIVQAQEYGQYEYENSVLYIMDSDYNLLSPQPFDYVTGRLGDLISTSSNRENAKVFNLASRKFVKLPRYGSVHLFTLDGKNVLINAMSSYQSAIFDCEGNVLIDGYKYISSTEKSKYLFAIKYTKDGDRLDVYNENIQRIFDKSIKYWYEATGFPFIFFKFEGENYIRIFDRKTMKQVSDMTFESLGGYTHGKYIANTSNPKRSILLDKNYNIYDRKTGELIGNLLDAQNAMKMQESKNRSKKIVLTEGQFAALMNNINESQDILLEGGDSRLKPIKNIIRTAFEGTALNPDDYVPSAEYYVPNRGEQTTWMHYLIYSLRHRFDLMGNGDVPLLRNVAKIAFLELNFEKENQDPEKLNILDRIIQLIKKDEESKLNFIQNKDATFSELYSQYGGILQQMDDEQVNTVNSKTYERNSNYEIVPINDFYTASEYGEYTGADGIGCLCYTTGRGTWGSFTNNGRNQCYLCHLQNYKEIPPIEGEGYPKDEYGLSMIWLFVNEMGRLVYSNVRWNHGDHTYDNVDTMFTESEISDIVGVNFYETFKPNSKWQDMVSKAMKMIAKGADPNDVFDDYQLLRNGYAVVKFDRKWNYITPEGEIMSKVWFDYCYSFKNGVGIVELDGKNNYLAADGKIISDIWFDYCGDFKDGIAKVGLNDKYNFLTKDGNILSDAWFDYCHGFENGFAKVELNDKQNFINAEGKIISDTWFDFGRNFENGISIISLDGKYNVLRMDGTLLSNVWLDMCYDFHGDMAVVQLNEKWNFLKKDGGFLFDKWFDSASLLDNGEGFVTIDGKCYMIDSKGNMTFLMNK